jgi:hypothetical protein
VTIDILQTTFFLTGAGFLSGKISMSIWDLMLKIHKKTKSHRFLSYAGSSIILFTFFIWALLFLVGLTLFFHFSDYSIINATTKIPADFWDKVYYVGFTSTTLGIGDFIAGSNFWEILTIISAINGFFLLTLVITYLIPLVSSVEEKRQFASTINNIGETPEKFLKRLKNGDKYENLSSILISYQTVINSMTQHHLAYPALHYFHSMERKTASAPAIAVLDEALSMVILCYGDNVKNISNMILPTKDAINNLLQTLEDSFIGSGNDSPALPNYDSIREVNKEIDENSFSEYYKSIEKRRKILLTYVQSDGWQWEDVTG